MELKPARTQAKQDPLRIIADLDKFASNSVGFIFNGKTHTLGEVTGHQLVSMEIARLSLINGDETMTDLEKDELVSKIISPLVPTLQFADIRAMNDMQKNSIMTLIGRKLKGDASLFEEGVLKKKPRTLVQQIKERFSSLRT